MSEQAQQQDESAHRAVGSNVGLGAWQPIETAPRDRRVLLCGVGGGRWTGYWRHAEKRYVTPGWTRDNQYDLGWEPVCWMDIPEAPNYAAVSKRQSFT